LLEYSLVHDKKGEQRERGEEGKDDEIGISEGGFEGFFEQVEEPQLLLFHHGFSGK
jgi:hypothetical protein